MKRDLTEGPVMKAVLLFTWSMLLGNLLQQCYNMADTWIVGKALGSQALAAVGSAFTLMTFLTSILIGLCMGAGSLEDRMMQGVKKSVKLVVIFCLLVSFFVYLFAPSLIQIFVESGEKEIIVAGTRYLRTEGIFYWGIGLLFLFYGYYRAVELPIMSVVLTVISLGTRVVLSYLLAPQVGEIMIWYAILIGWILADMVGAIVYYRRRRGQ